MERIVIVGGSLAGVRAAESLRQEGFAGELTVVDADPHPQPYDRYPLSKEFLTGLRDTGDIVLRTHDIDAVWRQGRCATSLDLDRRTVTLDDGSALRFDGLIVATGASARTLGASDKALRGVFALRTLADALALRAALREAPARVVVVGGGLIGSEVATVTRSMDLATTIVDSNQLPLSRTLGSAMATSVARLHAQRGVRVLPGRRVAGLIGRAGSVKAVRLTDGESIPADVVVVALGVVANTHWLEGSGLTLADGLVCEQTLYASGTTNVVAAGDVARWPQPLCGNEWIRIEHWSNALDQASMAAKNLLRGAGEAATFSDIPTFGSHIHGAAIRSIGFPPHATGSRILWGSVDDEEYVVGFHRADDVLIGVIALNAVDRLPHWRGQMGSSKLWSPEGVA